MEVWNVGKKHFVRRLEGLQIIVLRFDAETVIVRRAKDELRLPFAQWCMLPFDMSR